MKKERYSEPITVLYALSDKNGTYSKYVGTSIYSLFQNTKSKVVVYIFHDGSLSKENIEKLNKLRDKNKNKIILINVREKEKEKCEKARKIFAEAMQENTRYPESAMYRLMAPQILKNEKRIIYLDADTIINMDIKELWNEELNDSGIGVVGEHDLLSHYGKAKEEHAESDLQEKILNRIEGANLKNAFNSGVLLMDLEKIRKIGDMLLPGVEFLAKYPGESKFFDQDILNYFFATKATRLPWYYNILIHWDKMYTDKGIHKGIYHYMGHALEMNPVSPYDVMFYDYFIKTPWCDGRFFCSVYWTGENIIKNLISPVLKDLHTILHLLTRKKMVIAVTDEKIDTIMRLFKNPSDINLDCSQDTSKNNEKKDDFSEDEIKEICEKEKIVLYKLGNEDEHLNLTLPYDVDEYIYVFFVKDYKTIKAVLTKSGLKEREHFIDGVALTLGEKWLRMRLNQGLFFSVL